ncbi:aldehyde dehydrogenase family protein [Phytopseudomonas dryadis]|uniref:Aldehyde dehydrogenase family protein n=1 Tax=Phytopseudomonas dryadis TaxID=2487520 RepID=A0A4Q9QWG9_9GAMM|nr:aldehyde dehydrogenase family protein [Pseudomonas dryadis]TBU87436.1 aldehyde dehydrogenase family protein [Pseudomonas dryadis]
MRFDNYIDGRWRAGAEYRGNLNPSDQDDLIGDYAQADAGQTGEAIAAARAAFPAWAQVSPQQRFDILDGAGSLILARREELGRLLAREEGKTLPEAIAEVGRAGQIFKFFAGEALRLHGEILGSVRPGLNVEVTREPLGVVGLITPWNFPMAIPAWKIAPALAYGNTLVFKPAELVPGCAWALVDILAEAGVPGGVVNLVMGSGAVVGQALSESPQVDAVSFTGSVHTGQRIAAACLPLRKKLQLEMGGKNPMVVLDDADLEVAVEACINGAFHATGQRCTASSRLIVTAGIHDRFVAAMLERMAALRVGHALEAAVDIGPVVDAAQLRRNQAYLDVARSEGGQVHGGELLERDTRGFFMRPALVVGAEPHMRISREEVFGPIASILRAEDYAEALAMANDSEFGLSAGICTRSLSHASHFKRHVQAGMVMINAATAGVDYHVPFGGRKHSSYGPREQGSHAREFYTLVKTTYLNAGSVPA